MINGRGQSELTGEPAKVLALRGARTRSDLPDLVEQYQTLLPLLVQTETEVKRAVVAERRGRDRELVYKVAAHTFLRNPGVYGPFEGRAESFVADDSDANYLELIIDKRAAAVPLGAAAFGALGIRLEADPRVRHSSLIVVDLIDGQTPLPPDLQTAINTLGIDNSPSPFPGIRTQ